jgi:hypothetical protein
MSDSMAMHKLLIFELRIDKKASRDYGTFEWRDNHATA